jgi:hypothetical protein
VSGNDPMLDKINRARQKEADRLARRAATSSRVREKIEREQQRRELERQQQALIERLDVAKNGIQALMKESFGDSTKSFVTYLRLLEKAKKVKPGGLHPSQFDSKKEMVEMVLVTGIFWDLARTLDRTRNRKHIREMQSYLNQFVLFAKDAPFKALCAETLRKFLAAEKPFHRGDFRAAYKKLGGTSCFIASSLLDVADLETLPRLRAFRDDRLVHTRLGRRFVARYEAWSPAVAAVLDRSPEFFRRLCARALDAVSRLV